MRDTQRSKVYGWERATFTTDGNFTEELTMQECKRIISHVRDAYGVYTYFRVADGRGCRFARAGSTTITLPRWARNRFVVLHELAHHILCVNGTNDAHGPKFTRLLIELLAWAKIDTKANLLRTARFAKLKIAPAAKVPSRSANRRALSIMKAAA